MNLLFDIENRTIKELKEDSEEIRLSKLETRLLMVLSNGVENTWEEIVKFVYGIEYKGWTEDKVIANRIKCLTSRMTKKLKINIANLYGYGFMLTDNIFIM